MPNWICAVAGGGRDDGWYVIIQQVHCVAWRARDQDLEVVPDLSALSLIQLPPLLHFTSMCLSYSQLILDMIWFIFWNIFVSHHLYQVKLSRDSSTECQCVAYLVWQLIWGHVAIITMWHIHMTIMKLWRICLTIMTLWHLHDSNRQNNGHIYVWLADPYGYKVQGAWMKITGIYFKQTIIFTTFPQPEQE